MLLGKGETFMTINRTRITLALFVLAVYCACVSPALGQPTPAPRTRLPAVIKYDGDMAAMLANLTDIYGVTIGLEINPQQPRAQVGFDLRDPTLTDVLNAITKSAPRYQWRQSGEFIEVLPQQDSSPLLETIVSSFRVTEVDGTEAFNQLLNLPDVQASMRAMRLNRRDLTNASARQSKSAKFSLSLEGITMRQALNRIANEDRARFWIFQRDRNGYFSISNTPR